MDFEMESEDTAGPDKEMKIKLLEELIEKIIGHDAGESQESPKEEMADVPDEEKLAALKGV